MSALLFLPTVTMKHTDQALCDVDTDEIKEGVVYYLVYYHILSLDDLQEKTPRPSNFFQTGHDRR